MWALEPRLGRGYHYLSPVSAVRKTVRSLSHVHDHSVTSVSWSFIAGKEMMLAQAGKHSFWRPHSLGLKGRGQAWQRYSDCIVAHAYV